MSAGVSVYRLLDPRTGAIRYVGYSRDPRRRLQAHLNSDNLRKHTHKSHWILSLIALGLKPVMEIVYVVDTIDAAKLAEIALIASLKAGGAKLTNGTAGGDGQNGAVFSDEHRAKLRAARMGRPSPAKGYRFTDEQRATLSAATKGHRGRVFTEAQRQHLANLKCGKPLSDKHRRRISLAGKGKHQCSAATKAKMSAALKGRVFSEEHCRHLSHAHRGKRPSLETRQKMSKSHYGNRNYFLGKIHSTETRAKMRRAWVRRRIARVAVTHPQLVRSMLTMSRFLTAAQL